MANKATDIIHYENIADAIRYKNNSDTTYRPPEMAKAIISISNEIPNHVSFQKSTFVNPDLSGFNVSQNPYLGSLFYRCSNLETIDLSSWTFNESTDMYAIFGFCTSLTSVTFNTNNHIRAGLSQAFLDCSALTSIDLSWITNIDTGYGEVFAGCSSLTSVNIYDMNVTSGKVILADVFRGCSSLTSLDLSSWVLEPTENSSLYELFSGCTSLMHIDVRNINFLMFNNLWNTFNGVPTNCEIIVKDQTNKDWFATNFPNLTNVVIANN